MTRDIERCLVSTSQNVELNMSFKYLCLSNTTTWTRLSHLRRGKLLSSARTAPRTTAAGEGGGGGGRRHLLHARHVGGRKRGISERGGDYFFYVFSSVTRLRRRLLHEHQPVCLFFIIKLSLRCATITKPPCCMII